MNAENKLKVFVMTSCKNTQPGDQCREVYCESGLQQWRAMPGEHLCYVEQAGTITCLEVTRFTRPYFCLQPQSFGYTNDVFPPAIRVQYGCSAEFRVCFSSPVFSDSLYQAPGFQYVDHSNEHPLTTNHSSSVPSSTKSSADSKSTQTTITPPSTSPTVSSQTQILQRNQNSSSAEILHRSSVHPLNTTPYIAACVPSVCIIAVVLMVIVLLWRRYQRKNVRACKTDDDKVNAELPNMASITQTEGRRTELATPHSTVNVDDIVMKQPNQITDSSHTTSEPSTSSDGLNGNAPIKRRSEHIYYTLESATKYRQQSEGLQSVKPSNTCHDVNEKETCHGIKQLEVCDGVSDGCLSEEMYDNLRNRWSEYSEDRYDHMNAYVTLCRNQTSGNIVGQDYAHINSTDCHSCT